MTNRFGVPLPEKHDLPAMPRGIVLHWTGGSHHANSTDLAAYHFVVEADGTVRVGRWPVSANMRKVGGQNYAMHTGGFNSYRIGISAAGMKDYSGAKDVGPYPLTAIQINRMCELAAYFCDLAGLDPMDPDAVCTHREVWTIHRIKGKHNHQKRDIDHLPFLPKLKPDEVGPFLRSLTVDYLVDMKLTAVQPEIAVPAEEVPNLNTIHVPARTSPPIAARQSNLGGVMSETRANKPGPKTSEFWVSAATIAGTLLVATGIATPDQADAIPEAATAIVQATAAVSAAVTAVGYAISRARVKIGL